MDFFSSDLFRYMLVAVFGVIALAPLVLWTYGRDQRRSRAKLQRILTYGAAHAGSDVVRGDPDAIEAALEGLDERIHVKYLVTATQSARRAWRVFEDWIELSDGDDPGTADIVIVPLGAAIKDFSAPLGRSRGFRGEPINAANIVVLVREDGRVCGVIPISSSRFCQSVMGHFARAMGGLRWGS